MVRLRHSGARFRVLGLSTPLLSLPTELLAYGAGLPWTRWSWGVGARSYGAYDDLPSANTRVAPNTVGKAPKEGECQERRPTPYSVTTTCFQGSHAVVATLELRVLWGNRGGEKILGHKQLNPQRSSPPEASVTTVLCNATPVSSGWKEQLNSRQQPQSPVFCLHPGDAGCGHRVSVQNRDALHQQPEPDVLARRNGQGHSAMVQGSPEDVLWHGCCGPGSCPSADVSINTLQMRNALCSCDPRTAPCLRATCSLWLFGVQSPHHFTGRGTRGPRSARLTGFCSGGWHLLLLLLLTPRGLEMLCAQPRRLHPYSNFTDEESNAGAESHWSKDGAGTRPSTGEMQASGCDALRARLRPGESAFPRHWRSLSDSCPRPCPRGHTAACGRTVPPWAFVMAPME